ncbi:MAG TPA: SDR family NAD(P)-dependent oxidoreductase, partial [Terriglobales bacterium]|nr:SDR family NAD(P)-dependent oxidoreductase [Terriglobales bacterium]
MLGTSTERVPQAFINRGVQLALDAALCALAIFIAYQLRFDGSVPEAHRRVMWSLMLLLPFVRPLLMLSLGAYDAIWRYFNLRDATVLALSAAPPSVALLLLRYLVAQKLWGTVVPASVIVVELGLYLGFASLLRILRRVTYEATRPAATERCRALLVGTESSLPKALRHLSGSGEIEIIGLLAPEEKLQGLRIGGFLVMEQPEALPRLLVTQDINLILIADAGPGWIGEVVATAAEFGVEVRLLPSAANVIRGDVRVSARANAEVALSRAPAEQGSKPAAVRPHPVVVENFRDRVVLVTGAGGSIGSELARQVAALPVSTLVLLDRDENSIFEITNSLAATHSAGASAHITSVVADIRDADHLRLIFEKYRPHVVLHAAAYKHVPLMEANASEAVLNNVTGTRLVARAAVNFGAERFVMISTDKAVRPTSVMGASKRVAEMLVSQQAHEQVRRGASEFTRVACVRFGNVVGSR